jgi:hypothetical protein
MLIDHRTAQRVAVEAHGKPPECSLIQRGLTVEIRWRKVDPMSKGDFPVWGLLSFIKEIFPD